jgi:hypothetical protein
MRVFIEQRLGQQGIYKLHFFPTAPVREVMQAGFYRTTTPLHQILVGKYQGAL